MPDHLAALSSREPPPAETLAWLRTVIASCARPSFSAVARELRCSRRRVARWCSLHWPVQQTFATAEREHYHRTEQRWESRADQRRAKRAERATKERAARAERKQRLDATRAEVQGEIARRLPELTMTELRALLARMEEP